MSKEQPQPGNKKESVRDKFTSFEKERIEKILEKLGDAEGHSEMA